MHPYRPGMSHTVPVSRRVPLHGCTLRFFAGAISILSAEVAAQPLAAVLPRWPPAERAQYAAYESAMLALPTRDSLLEWHQMLASEPHIAGTDGDRKVIEAIAGTLRGMGLEVEVHEFWPLLAWPVSGALELVAPEVKTLAIQERILPEDPFSGHQGLTPGWNAYSASGDVTGAVVYANYGTKADFATLAAKGIDCRGRIVLARYGGNYRGFKAKFAEDAGAVGLVIFTDPADAGYVKGLTYPEGTWANETCIQRGSINTLGYPGDPLTPGREATQDAERLDPDAIALPRIPVQPVGWQAAQEIMSRMTGPAVPEGWQGGMPFTYRLSGGDALKVRLQVEQERKIRSTANVLGILRGETHPEQMMVIGAHHDAWGFGAADPTCGTICVLEAARAFTTLAKQGRRPARTLLFAAWGAEEFGIIGSTEWVERERDNLIANALGYINLDMAVTGPDFGSSASPALRRLIAECARSIPQARDPTRSVFDAWTAKAKDDAGRPRFGDLGGGSDHIGFLCHAGVSSCSLGSGGAPGTSYHSAYDTLPWYWKTVGDDYEPAMMVTRMTIAVASRLANAPLLPLDPVRPVQDFRAHLRDAAARAVKAGIVEAGDSLPGEFAQADSLAAEAERRLSAAMDALLAGLEAGAVPVSRLAQVNTLLLWLDRFWLDEGGLVDRPWFKNLYAANDEDSGYASWMLPALRAAIERHDGALLAASLRAYEDRLRAMAEMAANLSP